MEVKKTYLCDIYNKVSRSVKVKALILLIIITSCIIYFGIKHCCYQKMLDYYVACYDEVKLVQYEIAEKKSVEDLELLGNVIRITAENEGAETIYRFTYANAELGCKAYKIMGSVRFTANGKVSFVSPATSSKEKFIEDVDVIMIQYTIIGVMVVIGSICLFINVVICISAIHQDVDAGPSKEKQQ